MIAFQLVAVALSLANPDPAAPRAAASPAADAAAPAAKVQSATRYCVEQTVTGSRIPQRECRTRAAWLNLGFDPLAAN